MTSNAAHGAAARDPFLQPAGAELRLPDGRRARRNGTAGASTGRLELKAVGESPINPNNGDQADVQLTASISDVRNKAGLTDYTGELRAVLGLRITDRHNGVCSISRRPQATRASPSTCPARRRLGPRAATCNAATTVDAVTGGELAREGRRSVWELSQVQVFDGGADGDADTTGDNTLFAVQGLFTP